MYQKSRTRSRNHRASLSDRPCSNSSTEAVHCNRRWKKEADPKPELCLPFRVASVRQGKKFSTFRFQNFEADFRGNFLLSIGVSDIQIKLQCFTPITDKTAPCQFTDNFEADGVAVLNCANVRQPGYHNTEGFVVPGITTTLDMSNSRINNFLFNILDGTYRLQNLKARETAFRTC